MAETLTILSFCTVLLLSVLSGIDVVYALLLGLMIFWSYGLYRRFPAKALLKMSLEGVISARNILYTFAFIGMMTALWRACGTVPVIVSLAVDYLRPEIMVLLTFLLNALISVLIGSSFATSATAGVICMSVSNTMGLSAFWTGGAVLAGSFFGDRWSPVSTSALLVADLTGTDLYGNLKRAVKGTLIPLLLSCLVYWLAGRLQQGTPAVSDVRALFLREYSLSLLGLLPAAAVLLMAAFRCKVRPTMAVSSAVAFLLAWRIEGQSLPVLLGSIFTGFTARDAQVGQLLNGGGVLSMIRTALVVGIASCYAGIFRKTGLLGNLNEKIHRLGEKTCVYTASLIVSVFSSMIACNQTLAIMLTNQLCAENYEHKEELSLDLMDSAVVTAPLIPWTIAASVPLTMVGAPLSGVLSAVFLYFLPLYRLAGEALRKKRN